MSKYMDNNSKVGLDENSACLYCENPNTEPNMIESPKVGAPPLAGGTMPSGPSHSELTYADDNSVAATSDGNMADSRAKNPNTIIEVPSADASPIEVKNFSVDDFLTTMYSPGTNTDERPNSSGLYGKQKGV